MHISDLLIKLSTYKIDLFALDSFESHHFISHSLNLISYTGTLILMAIYLNCELLKLQVMFTGEWMSLCKYFLSKTMFEYRIAYLT